MQTIVFSGLQGGCKSTFYRDRFADTHVRINLDMLKTRTRENILLHACLAAQQPFVIDNTNPTAEQRTRYVRLARAAGFSVELYFFEIDVEASIRRNAVRSEPVPELAIRGTFAKMERPTAAEGFDRIQLVILLDGGGFAVKPMGTETP